MINIKDALQYGTTSLTTETSRTDAEILLSHILHKSRTFLYTYPEYAISKELWQTYTTLLQQRATGIPIAYLTKTKEFWSISLSINESVLIPRPETELLVELCLQYLAHEPNANILDLGTGSGAIALALASEKPNWHILACDISHAAVSLATQNASSLKLQNVNILQSNWFQNINNHTKFHAIIANPPYIEAQDPHLSQGDVRFEPRHALISGTDGLTALRSIINDSYDWLLPNGILLLEHGYLQRESVARLLQERGYTQIQCIQDYQGNDRVSTAIRHNNNFKVDQS